MIRVKMLADYQGAKKGDVVGFEDDNEAATLIVDGKAVPVVWDDAAQKYVAA